jgi:hypothetical protein
LHYSSDGEPLAPVKSLAQVGKFTGTSVKSCTGLYIDWHQCQVWQRYIYQLAQVSSVAQVYISTGTIVKSGTGLYIGWHRCQLWHRVIYRLAPMSSRQRFIYRLALVSHLAQVYKSAGTRVNSGTGLYIGWQRCQVWQRCIYRLAPMSSLAEVYISTGTSDVWHRFIYRLEPVSNLAQIYISSGTGVKSGTGVYSDWH